MRLAAQCVIIIENFRPGVVQALGIGYEQVRKVNSGIIYCSISGFGQDGAYRDRGGHDLNFVSMSGILDGNREPKFWQNFCKAVGREDLLPDHRSPAEPGNQAYRQMQDLFAQATLGEWQERLKLVDCCFAPVLTRTEALQSEYVLARDIQLNLHHPTEGLLKQIPFPVKVHKPGEPSQPHSLRDNPPEPPPRWGEHTDLVLEEFGLTQAEITELKGLGVLG